MGRKRANDDRVLLICFAAGLWSTVGVANAFMSADSGNAPAFSALVRTSLGAASLLLAAPLLRVPGPARRQVPLAALAIFGLSGATFQICLFAAFKEAGVTVTVAVTVCAPVLIVAAADALRTRTAPNREAVATLILGTTGVVLVVLGPYGSTGGWVANLYGSALLLGASVAFASLALVTREITRCLDPVRAAGLGLAASAVALGAMMGLGIGSTDLSSTLSTPSWDLVILLYIGVAATGLAYLAFVLGMQLCSSASAGLAATMVEPGMAALLAATLLNERLSTLEIGGCAMMLLAMILLAWSERSKRTRSRRKAARSGLASVTSRTS